MSRKGNVEVIGIPELERALTDARVEIRQAAEAAVDEELDRIAADMKRTAPRKTGELRRSIRAHPERDEVRATARHAGFVERGTSSTPAQPFAAPAAERARIRVPKTLAARIRAAIAGLGK